MGVRHEHDVLVACAFGGFPDLGQDSVGPFTDGRRGLARVGLRAGRDTVGPEVPAGAGEMDVVGGDALVAAVVPFAQLRGDAGRGQSREFGGAPGAYGGADQGERDVPVGEQGREGAGLAFAQGRQGQVGVARVLSVAGPLGLAVPDQDQLAHVKAIRSQCCYRSRAVVGANPLVHDRIPCRGGAGGRARE